MKSFIRGIKNFTNNIGIVLTSSLLFLIYFIGVAITSMLARIAGKHFLDNEKRESYWHVLDLKEKPIEEWYRQF
ncbi:MAG: hypothetical protein AABX71_02030 [Nanoarchaeota archaeon]